MTPTKDEVVKARAAAGLTQKQAAALVHVSERMWQYYEAGSERMPPQRWELFNLKRAPAPQTS
jgi:putative transcriptional regulator